MSSDFIEIEQKEDSAEKLAAIDGQPTKHYLFAPEINLIKQRINELKSGLNNLVREVFIGFANNRTERDALLNATELEVSDNELVIVTYFTPVSGMAGTWVQASLIWKLGKRELSVIGSAGFTHKFFELPVVYPTQDSIEQLISAPDAVVNDYGMFTGTIIDYINNHEPVDYDQEGKVYYIRGNKSGVDYLWRFNGSTGTYGDGEGQMDDEDIELLFSSDSNGFVFDPSLFDPSLFDLAQFQNNSINKFVRQNELPPTAEIPNLQQVLDQGSTAENNPQIYLTDGYDQALEMSPYGVLVGDGINGSIMTSNELGLMISSEGIYIQNFGDGINIFKFWYLGQNLARVILKFTNPGVAGNFNFIIPGITQDETAATREWANAKFGNLVRQIDGPSGSIINVGASESLVYSLFIPANTLSENILNSIRFPFEKITAAATALQLRMYASNNEFTLGNQFAFYSNSAVTRLSFTYEREFQILGGNLDPNRFPVGITRLSNKGDTVAGTPSTVAFDVSQNNWIHLTAVHTSVSGDVQCIKGILNYK